MTKKPILAVLIVAFFVISAGIVYTQNTPALLDSIKVKVVKDQDSNIWRVRDLSDRKKGTIKAKRKDRVQWKAVGSAMIFTFQNARVYFEYDSGMFADGKSQEIAKDNKLKLRIKESAPSDTLEYKVYIVDADTVAVGDSPPKLIIQ